jgi:SecD/SecF fusion protein
VAGLLALPIGFAFGQEVTARDAAVEVAAPAAASDTADDAEQPAATAGQPVADGAPAAAAAPSGATADQPAAGDEPPAEVESPAASEAEAPASANAPAGAAPTAANGTPGLSPLMIGVILAALFILPVMVGNFLAKRLKMPDHAWKISVVLGTFAASVVVFAFGQLKYGPDLAGGITLIYEVAEPGSQPAGDDAAAAQQQQVPMADMITALKQRVDPTGTREVTIRQYGLAAVEIIIPQTGPDALEYVKRRITEMGQLEFRITADPEQPDDRPIIEQAQLVPPSQTDVTLGGRKVAEWVTYAEAEFGPPDQTDNRVVKRMAGDTPEALVLMDPWNATGEQLISATKGVDEQGGPAVNFSFNALGASRFRQLTSENKPNPVTGAMRYLGIVLDKRLISAPSIRTTISTHGQISGGAMDEKEVDFIISILQAGRLPLALNKVPISEEIMSPTLGAETIQQGKRAIWISMAMVALFMLVYYRFSGIVACLALAFNLLLVLALMVLIQATFTLPGLAGLALTIGMSVDANVLIYERMREELKHGAALRMAIRNGFSRAMSAIVDSNVTTIIAGIALYIIGTDQVKGFAVTLILGILTSMFTAIFFARLVFDIAERRGWIKVLKMMHILTDPHYDFLGVRHVAIGVSLVVIAIGAVAVVGRGTQLLDIDFTGGSSVTFVLKESDRMSIGKVRGALLDTELADRNLVVVSHGDTQTRYTVSTSEQSVERVKELLGEAFPDKLQTFSVVVSEVQPFTEGTLSGTQAKLMINEGPAFGADDGMSRDAVRDYVVQSLTAIGQRRIIPILSNPNYRTGSTARFKEWTVRLPDLDESVAQGVFGHLKGAVEAMPMFPLANKIGGRVSGNMQAQAMWAIIISLVGVVAYLWLRFQKVNYGLAAAVAVVHDVLVTIGLLALSAYIVNAVPGLAAALKIDSFQIGLTIVAALLTIIGYSLNDTIVTFDRLREIKGKSPSLTMEMVNLSVNQTLSRTILTSLTVFMVVVILYFFGGDGIHAFAYAFLVGVIAGSYSTIYIAAPVLLWLSGTSMKEATLPEPPRVVERVG